jgi:3-oxoacyl-(acyl-carrier-protein) synthase
LPYFLTKSFPHATATETGSLTGFQSQIMTFATACTAGMNAIGYACKEIAAGGGDAFLCISTDATIANCAFAHFCRSGMLTSNNDDPQHASRPYDAKRDGGVLGEGAGGLLLEELSHARRRGAKIYGEILGFGTSGSGYGGDPATMIPQGMATAMTQAMVSANCGPSAIDYIGSHGVSDKVLDAWETVAMKKTFGERAYEIPMSSIKSMIGIPQNAAGVLQLIATTMAMKDGILPATTNYEYADPECDLDYVPNVPRRNHVERALVLAHGFNGSDAALLLGRTILP